MKSQSRVGAWTAMIVGSLYFLIPLIATFEFSLRMKRGIYSFGIANDFQQAALAQARVVIAEVNDQLPWTYCDGAISPARIDYFVRTSRPLPQARVQPISPTEQRIAELQKRGINARLVAVNGIQHYETYKFVDALRQAVPWVEEIWKTK